MRELRKNFRSEKKEKKRNRVVKLILGGASFVYIIVLSGGSGESTASNLWLHGTEVSNDCHLYSTHTSPLKRKLSIGQKHSHIYIK